MLEHRIPLGPDNKRLLNALRFLWGGALTFLVGLLMLVGLRSSSSWGFLSILLSSYGALLSVSGLTVVRGKKLSGQEIFWNDEVLGYRRTGEIVWSLAWDQFGGFSTRNSRWYLPDGSLRAIEIYDEDKVKVGELPIPMESGAGPLAQEMFSQLMARVGECTPSNGIRPPTREVWPHRYTPPFAARVMLLGLAVLVAGIIGFWKGGIQGLNLPGMGAGWSALTIILSIIVGVLLSGWGAATLLAKRHAGRKVQGPVPVPEIVLEEGPDIEALRLSHLTAGGMIELLPGADYRYSDPMKLKGILKSGPWDSLFLIGVSVLASTMVVYFSLKSGSSLSLLVALLSVVVLGINTLNGIRNIKKGILKRSLRDSLNDLISISETQLIITRPNGTKLEFPRHLLAPMPVKTEIEPILLKHGDQEYVIEPALLYRVVPASFQVTEAVTERNAELLNP